MSEESPRVLTSGEGVDFPEDGTSQAHTASGFLHCKGTCQAGMCTMTPRDAHRCFSEDKRDEEYAPYGKKNWRQHSYKSYDGPEPWQAPRKYKDYYEEKDGDG